MNSLRQDMNFMEEGRKWMVVFYPCHVFTGHGQTSELVRCLETNRDSRPMPGTDNKIYEFPERVILRANEKNRG